MASFPFSPGPLGQLVGRAGVERGHNPASARWKPQREQ